MRTSAITLIVATVFAEVVLSISANRSHAISVNYIPLVFDQPSYSQSGVTASGSANVISLDSSTGLAIKGATSDFSSVEYPETITFTFAADALDVLLDFEYVTGLDTANTEIEAFAPGGGTLGSLTINLFGNHPTLVSSLYANVPIESFTLRPLTTNFLNYSTDFRISTISWETPEPTSLVLSALGLLACCYSRRRRG